MKTAPIFLALSLLVTPLIAQEPDAKPSASAQVPVDTRATTATSALTSGTAEGSASVETSSSASVQISGNQTSVSANQPSTQNSAAWTVTSDEELRQKWLKEAASLSNAEVIDGNQTVSNYSLRGKSLVIHGNVNGNLSVLQGSIYVLGNVNGNVSVVNGNLVVLGAVNGSASVVGGDLRLGGTVERASVVGGEIQRLAGSVLKSYTQVGGNSTSGGNNTNNTVKFNISEKDIESILRSLGLDEDFFKSIQSATDHINTTFFLTFGLFSLVFWLALAVIAEFLFPKIVENGATLLNQSTLQAFFAGFIFWIAFWCITLVSLVLCFLLIGIPMLAGLFFAFFAIKAFGLAIVYQLIGRIISKRFEWNKVNAIQCVLIGGVALGLLEMVPFVGFWIGIVIGIFGAGIVMLLLGQRISRGAQIAATPVLPSGPTP